MLKIMAVHNNHRPRKDQKFMNVSMCETVLRPHPSFLDGQLEVQFKKWVRDWERRVFKNKLLVPNQVCYFYNQDQHHLISELVDSYHETCSEQIGQDRFVWTTFACAIIKAHNHYIQRKRWPSEKCHINRCLYVLLWISFYLRLPCSELVKEIVREIIACTGNLRFMFSFLPGMSIRLYILLLWNNTPLYEERLCKEYFSLIDSESSDESAQYKDVFKLSQPLLLYLVQHLTPLHMKHSQFSFTLYEILNRPLIFERKYSVLTLAIGYHDQNLVKLLLEIGAGAQVLYWDSCMENSISAEKIMINSINSIMGSRQFLISINHVFEELTQYMDSVLNTVGSYVPLIQRSVFRSELRKSNNIWSSEDSTYELNREIADMWGIGYERTWPSLQHICKIKIRKCILQADRELLPKAIQTLPLPNKLIQYLKLQLD